MFHKIKHVLLLVVAFVTISATAQQMPSLPVDKAVKIGKLPNGLTYYIRHNALPEHRANFYIAQKVGAVQEEESQRGLAHFLEHMCFNGTQSFPGNGIIKYLESIGVKFGQELNAYTSIDETVYNIDNVPVSEANIDSCLTILHDWADGLLLEPAEIDKERGVIHEEWRMRSTASMRMFERNLPKLFPGSRYGERFPIGLMSVIDNFKYQELRDYYEKWYRPDLQGIIVVGDINVDSVEARIKDIFSPIKMPENPAAYESYPVPDNNEAIYIVDKDKEQAMPMFQIFFKHDVLPTELRGTVAKLMMDYMSSVVSGVLNERLQEMTQKDDCPFTMAASFDDSYMGMTKMKDAYILYVIPKEGKATEALKTVMTEVERVRRFGLTATEVNRQRDEYLSTLEKTYDNRDKQTHDFFVPQYVRHFLEGDAIPDIATTYQLMQQVAPSLKAEMFSEVAKEWMASTDTNFVCVGMFPDKEGVVLPTPDELKAAVEAVKAAQLEAYVDNVKNDPLVPNLPKPVKIKSVTSAPMGYTCWTLKNGARVFYKATDFDDSEVLVNVVSHGGKSLTSEKDRVNALMFEDAINSAGLGNFTSTELSKKLAGRQVELSVNFGEESEGLSGQSTPKDLRTLFELIYLRFQKPMADTEAWNSMMNRKKSMLENADKDPMKAFSDSIVSTIYGHNPLAAREKLADLPLADYGRIRQIYSERFASVGDFDFFFTGNVNVDSLRTFVEQYIAPLPGVKKRENYVNRHIEPVPGQNINHFKRQMETPQAYMLVMLSGKTEYSLKQSAIVSTLGDVLSQRYLKSIREDAGYAYAVQAMGMLMHHPNPYYLMQIVCPFKPAACDSVLTLINADLQDIADNGVTAEELDKVVKFELKTYADNQKKNGYWQSLITEKICWGVDNYEGYEKTVSSVTSDDLKDFVRNRILKEGNRVEVVMLPTDLTE